MYHVLSGMESLVDIDFVKVYVYVDLVASSPIV